MLKSQQNASIQSTVWKRFRIAVILVFFAIWIISVLFTLLLGGDLADGLTIDSQGNLYFSDFAHNVIHKFDSSGNSLLTFGSRGSNVGQFGQFGPNSVAVDSAGNVYATDDTHSVIEKFDANGKFIKEQSVQSQARDIGYVAIDQQNNVYVSDGNVIQKFDSNLKFLTEIGDSLNSVDSITSIHGLTIDAKGILYVAATVASKNQILKFDTKGNFLSSVGGIEGPGNIAVDSLGNLYISNKQFINKYDSNGKFVTSWNYTEQIEGYTNALAVDSENHLFVIDTMGYSIKKFDNDGQLLSEWYLRLPSWTNLVSMILVVFMWFFNVIGLLWRQVKIQTWKEIFEVAPSTAGKASQILGVFAPLAGVLSALIIRFNSNYVTDPFLPNYNPNNQYFYIYNVMFIVLYLFGLVATGLVARKPFLAGCVQILGGVSIFLISNNLTLQIFATLLCLAGILALIDNYRDRLVAKSS